MGWQVVLDQRGLSGQDGSEQRSACGGGDDSESEGWVDRSWMLE